MAFSTIANPIDGAAVSQAIVNFAVTNAGFTDEGSVVGNFYDASNPSPFAGNYTFHRLSKNGVYWHFSIDESARTLSTGNSLIVGIMSTQLESGFPSSADLNTTSQFRAAKTHIMVQSGGPFTQLNLFSDAAGTYVYAVLELITGVFTHICFGNIQKLGTWSGGEFLSLVGPADDVGTTTPAATSAPFPDKIVSGKVNSYIKQVPASGSTDGHDMFVPIGGTSLGGIPIFSEVNNGWSYVEGGYPINYNILATSMTEWRYLTPTNPPSSLMLGPFQAGYDQTNGLTPTLPIILRGFNTQSISNLETPDEMAYYFLGHAPGIRIVNIENLNAYDLLNSTWRVFPLTQKSGSLSNSTVSWYYGVAYEEVP